MTRIVIIGAGIVGCSLADELALRGETDVTVVDQGPLFATGGSTSHAPGLVFQTNPSRAMAQLATYTVEKLAGLDGAFAQLGGLELALTEERLADLHRRCGWAHSWGIPAQVLDAEAAASLHPLLDARLVLGGLHTPTDGLAFAVPAAEAQARRAMAAGVRFLGDHEVLEVLTDSAGAVRGVRTTQGDLDAELVVCCAGFWGPKVAGLVDLDLPLVPFAHQYATTDAVPALAALGPGPRPILRHQGADLYYREHGDAVGIGFYGHRPMPVAQADIRAHADGEPMPSVQPFTPEDFAPAWAESQRLLPGLADLPAPTGMNGIFSFTPDGGPLVGEHRDVPGFWVAEAVWVTHSAGVGRAVAQLLADGHSEVPLHEADLHRFAPVQHSREYVHARATRAFVEVYDVLHPLDPSDDARDLRVTPFHARQRAHGAYFLEALGWERPQFYGANADLPADVPARDAWSARHWSPIAAAEAQRTREAVAMYDMTPLMRLDVRGAGAADFLQRMTSNDLDKPVGAVTYTLLLGPDGGVRSDLTVARLGEDRFQVGANGPLDLDWLRAHAPAGVHVTDATPGSACIGLWGPRARDVLQPLTTTDVSHAALGYFKARELTVAGVPVTLLRVSYVGDLGWELYTSADCGARLWDALAAAGEPFGIVAAGRGALDALRIEKGYRAWGKDVTTEHDPYEAGLGWAVKLDKGDFVGRDALLAKADGDPARRLVPLLLDGDGSVPLGGEPVYAANGNGGGGVGNSDGGDSHDAATGYVTSAAWSPTLRRTIAYAWLDGAHAAADTPVEVGWFDRRLAATVATEPLVDPGMERIRR